MRRRWLDFRNGHSIYLVFMLTFVNFVIITYTLAIERFSFLESIFPSMWLWAVIFIAAYIPAAVVVGHFHRKLQIPTETRQMMDVNPFIYYLQPGREKLFNVPVSILGWKAQLHNMKMQNAIADAIEKLSKETGTTIPHIPRFDPTFFNEYQKAIYISERLSAGDNILEIMESFKNIQQEKEKEQVSNLSKE
jgi:hypothetical protein